MPVFQRRARGEFDATVWQLKAPAATIGPGKTRQGLAVEIKNE